MSYSQSNEECAILGALSSGGDLAPGIFLDIGAADGHDFSNTLALVERGWAGVLVEPSAHLFVRLLDLHRDRQNLDLVHCLIGNKPGLIPFWNTNGDLTSTTEQSHYDKWKGRCDFNSVCYVPQISVRDLIAQFPYLKDASFVSIDTEGTSEELFDSFPLDLCHPKVFCVEIDGDRERLMASAAHKGYRIIPTDGCNMVFTNGE